MINGSKADYNTGWFYTKEGYIYQKDTNKIVDVVIDTRYIHEFGWITCL